MINEEQAPTAIDTEAVLRALQRLIERPVNLRLDAGGAEVSHYGIVLDRITEVEDLLDPDETFRLEFGDCDALIVITGTSAVELRWDHVLRPKLSVRFGRGAMTLTDLSDEGRLEALERFVGQALCHGEPDEARGTVLKGALSVVDRLLADVQSAACLTRLRGLRTFLAPYEFVPPPCTDDDDLPF